MDYAAARHAMLENQVRANKVTDAKVIHAIDAIPREAFVADAIKGVAYVDEDLNLGNGRYLMEPMVLARLMQSAEIGDDDTVLDIGCATGYSTAVLARVAKAVVAVESDAEMAKQASDILTGLGIDNAAVIAGALDAGMAEQGPFDAIFVGGAVADVPETLVEQLADDGRLVAVVLDDKGLGRATLYRRNAGSVTQTVLFDASVPALPGFEKTQSFVF